MCAHVFAALLGVAVGSAEGAPTNMLAPPIHTFSGASSPASISCGRSMPCRLLDRSAAAC